MAGGVGWFPCIGSRRGAMEKIVCESCGYEGYADICGYCGKPQCPRCGYCGCDESFWEQVACGMLAE